MEKNQLYVIIVGVVLIGVYLVSLFSGPLLSSRRSTTQLPTNNILNYTLDPQLKNAFIYYNSTILTFEYSSNCDNCLEQKNFLEAFSTNYKQNLGTDFYNIYLEEFLNETINLPKLTIESNLGNTTLVNATENETFDAICNLMFFPPAICATR